MNDSPAPAPLLLIAALLVSGALAIGPNALLASYAIAVLLAAAVLLWRPGEPPVMLLIVLLQWLQASVKVFQGNINGVHVNQLAQFSGDVALSSALSLTALLVLAVGMRWGTGPWRADIALLSRQTALMHPPGTWFTWYLIALVLSFAANEFAGVVSALSQPLLALGTLKWAFFFMLTYAAFCGPTSSRRHWAAAAVIEFLQGVGGYFSDFKTVLFFCGLGIAAAGARLTVGRLTVLAVFSAIALYLAVLWTVVKVEYRSFVSGGEAAQVVEADYGGRMAYLYELVKGVDTRALSEGVDIFMSRLSYVDFFAVVVDHVPARVEHTQGAIWWDAIQRPFMPRALFPDKTVIDDSERTAQFTGMAITGADRGTSISIGYAGESYIDFGSVGMFAPILLMGYLLGRVYRWLTRDGSMRGLLGSGLACATLMSFAFLESSITKVFGGLVALVLVVWLFGRFLAPRYLAWLLLPAHATATPPADRAAGQPRQR